MLLDSYTSIHFRRRFSLSVLMLVFSFLLCEFPERNQYCKYAVVRWREKIKLKKIIRLNLILKIHFPHVSGRIFEIITEIVKIQNIT